MGKCPLMLGAPVCHHPYNRCGLMSSTICSHRLRNAGGQGDRDGAQLPCSAWVRRRALEQDVSVCIGLCAFVYVHKCVRVHACVSHCVCAFVYVDKCVCSCMCASLYVYICVCA